MYRHQLSKKVNAKAILCLKDSNNTWDAISKPAVLYFFKSLSNPNQLADKGNHSMFFSRPDMWMCENSNDQWFLKYFESLIERLRIKNFGKLNSHTVTNYLLSVIEQYYLYSFFYFFVCSKIK